MGDIIISSPFSSLKPVSPGDVITKANEQYYHQSKRAMLSSKQTSNQAVVFFSPRSFPEIFYKTRLFSRFMFLAYLFF